MPRTGEERHKTHRYASGKHRYRKSRELNRTRAQQGASWRKVGGGSHGRRAAARVGGHGSAGLAGAAVGEAVAAASRRGLPVHGSWHGFLGDGRHRKRGILGFLRLASKLFRERDGKGHGLA